jgi:hypothetical protein
MKAVDDIDDLTEEVKVINCNSLGIDNYLILINYILHKCKRLKKLVIKEDTIDEAIVLSSFAKLELAINPSITSLKLKFKVL